MPTKTTAKRGQMDRPVEQPVRPLTAHEVMLAIQALTRNGAGDLLAMLGLDDVNAFQEQTRMDQLAA